MISVYVACSSRELDRAKHWMAELRAVGIDVTSKWAENIEEVGEANPRGASDADRFKWSRQDLADVASADVLWFLVPEEASGGGAYFEAGYAHAVGCQVFFSGDTKQSIFASMGEEFSRDQDALDCIVYMAKNGGLGSFLP